MKSIKNILLELKEESSDDLTLSEVLDQIFELYVEETGDEDGEEYDAGLMLLADYAADIPDEVAADMIEDLVKMFGLDEEGDNDEEDEEESDEEIEESAHLEKKRKLKTAEKMANKKEYRTNKVKIKLNAKKWRKSAAGKKWTTKYKMAKKKFAGKNLKGKRISVS